MNFISEMSIGRVWRELGKGRLKIFVILGKSRGNFRIVGIILGA